MFEDNSTGFIAGTVRDLSHLSQLKESINKRKKKKVVGHTAIFLGLADLEAELFQKIRPIEI